MGEMYHLQELKVELLKQLEMENMVEMISFGELFRADGILKAALKMTKSSIFWLRNQVPY